MLCSASTGRGIAEIWDCILNHEQFQKDNGLREEVRREQTLSAMRQMISSELETSFRHDPAVAAKLKQVEEEVRKGRMTSFAGARALLGEFHYSAKTKRMR